MREVRLPRTSTFEGVEMLHCRCHDNVAAIIAVAGDIYAPMFGIAEYGFVSIRQIRRAVHSWLLDKRTGEWIDPLWDRNVDPAARGREVFYVGIPARIDGATRHIKPPLRYPPGRVGMLRCIGVEPRWTHDGRP